MSDATDHIQGFVSAALAATQGESDVVKSAAITAAGTPPVPPPDK